MKQKNYAPLICMLTIAINGLIATAYFIPKVDSLKGYDLSRLPLLNAIFNGSTFISLFTLSFFYAINKLRGYRNDQNHLLFDPDHPYIPGSIDRSPGTGYHELWTYRESKQTPQISRLDDAHLVVRQPDRGHCLPDDLAILSSLTI